MNHLKFIKDYIHLNLFDLYYQNSIIMFLNFSSLYQYYALKEQIFLLHHPHHNRLKVYNYSAKHLIFLNSLTNDFHFLMIQTHILNQVQNSNFKNQGKIIYFID
jgi:hypothetical protein